MEMKEVKKQTDGKMKDVLTEEQYEKYSSLKKDHKEKSHQHSRKGH